MSKGRLGSVIEAQQFDRETIEEIFQTAEAMERGVSSQRDLLRGKIMTSLFYEPSMRTRFSFESAMKRLGGDVISTENAREFSSASKGESLEDSVRVISGYCDLIVLRYHKEGGAKRAQNYAHVPVINAGDGTGQHPTQALLDLYTINKIFGSISGLKIAMVGDLANGRTVRSLAYFLAKHYPDNEIFFISPEQVKMRDDIKEYLDRHGLRWQEVKNFDGILSKLDVVYQTRVQKERFKKKQAVYKKIMRESKGLIIDQAKAGEMKESGIILHPLPSEYKKIMRESKGLIIDRAKAEEMKESGIILHPLPRLTEISHEVDDNHRAKYFEQAQNGLYVRMALLKMILAG